MPDELSAPMCTSPRRRRWELVRSTAQIMRRTLGQLCHKTGGHMRTNETRAEFNSRPTGTLTSSFESEEETVRRLCHGRSRLSRTGSLSDCQASSLRGTRNVSDALLFSAV